MSDGDWSDGENDLIVSDYFEMLASELSARPFNKAERNWALQSLLPRRSRGSIEFKHQNISAVLLGLGQPWIMGYKPASRFQLSLIDAVLKQLDERPFWTKPVHAKVTGDAWIRLSLAEPTSLWIGPPPTHSNAPPPVDPQFMAVIAQKYDVAARDHSNRELGQAGEAHILEYEIANLQACGRKDLAQNVRWTSQLDGDGAGYDIASFEPTGQPKLIEVKTTNGWDRTPFHLSRNELAVANNNRDQWCLIRLWNFAREPKAFELRPPLEPHVTLTPTSFLATPH
ncbi:MAG: hypothetical protein RL186_1262 [Pseudomonadota bacterium]|jgi:hypothetical protein